MPSGGPDVPLEVELADAIKQGKAIIKGMQEPIVGRLQASLVGPWSARVTALLASQNEPLARRFIESDEGAPPWNPMLVSPATHIAVMESRIAFLEEALLSIET